MPKRFEVPIYRKIFFSKFMKSFLSDVTEDDFDLLTSNYTLFSSEYK